MTTMTATLPADLSKASTADLMAALGEVGPAVITAKAKLDEARRARLALLVELDDRKVSYRVMAKASTGISHAAVLKALQAHHGAPKKPIV